VERSGPELAAPPVVNERSDRGGLDRFERFDAEAAAFAGAQAGPPPVWTTRLGLLWLIVVSASLLFDYGSERPPAVVRPWTAFRRGLSGAGWDDELVLGRDRGAGSEIDADGRDATRCKPV
jgi:hypothetical protein